MTQARALKSFSSTRFGNVAEGQRIEGELHLLRQMEQFGMVEIVEPKKPNSETGEAKPLQSSPAGQVLSGGKSDTLETKPEPSLSTQVTKSPRGRTSSTDATEAGGRSTATSSRKSRSGGRKTSKRRTSGG